MKRGGIVSVWAGVGGSISFNVFPRYTLLLPTLYTPLDSTYQAPTTHQTTSSTPTPHFKFKFKGGFDKL